MKVLLIESNEIDAHNLEQIIRQADPEIEILDRLTSVEASVRWLISRPLPDLIFLDIQLEDGICFDIFQEVKTQVPLVFTSRNSSWALRAFKFNTLGYLTKPFDKNAIISILYKYKLLIQYYASLTGDGDKLKVKELIRDDSQIQKKFRNRFLIQLGDKIKFIPASEVAWFKAEGNLVYLVTKHNDRHIMDKTLEEIGDVLDSVYFFRLNRTYICHVQALKDIRKYFNSRIKIILQPEPGNDDEVLVSRNRAHEFLHWLGS